MTRPTLRRQAQKRDEIRGSNGCLADFVHTSPSAVLPTGWLDQDERYAYVTLYSVWTTCSATSLDSLVAY